MAYISELKKGYYYLVEKVHGKKNILRPATIEEVEAHLAMRRDRAEFVTLRCPNPSCGRDFKILRSQMEDLMIKQFRQYHHLNYIYCSEACQQNHLKLLNIVPNNHINKKWSFDKASQN